MKKILLIWTLIITTPVQSAEYFLPNENTDVEHPELYSLGLFLLAGAGIFFTHWCMNRPSKPNPTITDPDFANAIIVPIVRSSNTSALQTSANAIVVKDKNDEEKWSQWLQSVPPPTRIDESSHTSSELPAIYPTTDADRKVTEKEKKSCTTSKKVSFAPDEILETVHLIKARLKKPDMKKRSSLEIAAFKALGLM